MSEEKDRSSSGGGADGEVGSGRVGEIDVAGFFVDEETEERDRSLRVDVTARGFYLPGGVEGRRLPEGRLAAMTSPLGLPTLGPDRAPAGRRPSTT
ncbi:MAG: hypothetical protein M3R38_23160 [Actinomycetota bacterium]|nr:hypothetical protein [Actinomycetota bacterium]